MQNIFGCKLIHSEDAELDFIDWAFTKKLTPDQTATLNIGRLSGRSWRQGVESERVGRFKAKRSEPSTIYASDS